jgi:hypothetical protein
MLLIYQDDKRWADVDEAERPAITRGDFAVTQAMVDADQAAAVDWARKLPGVERGFDRIEVLEVLPVPDMPS